MNGSQKLWTRVGNFSASVLRSCLLLFIGAYRTLGTQFLGGACRFEPSCSQYALEAAAQHHPVKAVQLICCRLGRCRPGGGSGFDPVPLKIKEAAS